MNQIGIRPLPVSAESLDRTDHIGQFAKRRAPVEALSRDTNDDTSAQAFPASPPPVPFPRVLPGL